MLIVHICITHGRASPRRARARVREAIDLDTAAAPRAPRGIPPEIPSFREALGGAGSAGAARAARGARVPVATGFEHGIVSRGFDDRQVHIISRGRRHRIDERGARSWRGFGYSRAPARAREFALSDLFWPQRGAGVSRRRLRGRRCAAFDFFFFLSGVDIPSIDGRARAPTATFFCARLLKKKNAAFFNRTASTRCVTSNVRWRFCFCFCRQKKQHFPSRFLLLLRSVQTKEINKNININININASGRFAKAREAEVQPAMASRGQKKKKKACKATPR